MPTCKEHPTPPYKLLQIFKRLSFEGLVYKSVKALQGSSKGSAFNALFTNLARHYKGTINKRHQDDYRLPNQSLERNILTMQPLQLKASPLVSTTPSGHASSMIKPRQSMISQVVPLQMGIANAVLHLSQLGQTIIDINTDRLIRRPSTHQTEPIHSYIVAPPRRRE